METLFNNLTEIIKNYHKIIIMAHQNPDLDALGSSLGLYEILTALEKEVYLFYKTSGETDYNNPVKEVLKKNSNLNYTYVRNCKDIIDDQTLLIILDVHQQFRIMYPSILQLVSNVVVIDHHIKNNDYIKDTQFFFIDSTMSSMAEVITSYSKYLNINITPSTATVMLAGIEIDTNGFNLKTTDKTYEAAAYLATMGADNVTKQELLKESKEEYLKRADYIKNSFMINKTVGMCLLNKEECTKEELAEIAEELLKFDSIESSFAIGKLDSKTIGVSARSIGLFNVCDVITKLGGGGHANNAATQIKNSTIKEVEASIKQILEELE